MVSFKILGGAYGNFMNDPMAAQFVGQVGQNAFKHVEQNVGFDVWYFRKGHVRSMLIYSQ